MDPISGVFVWSWPQNVTDWVNLGQLLTFWIGTLVLYVRMCELRLQYPLLLCIIVLKRTSLVSTRFVACLFTPSHSFGTKAWAVFIYLAVLMTTIVPSLIIITALEEHNGTAPVIPGAAIFFTMNIMFIVPPVTLLTAASFYFEGRAILSQPAGSDGIGSVSQTGLLAQAVVFAAVALSWVHRAAWPADRPGIGAGLWMGWYRLVGWAAVNNAIFAAGQAYLWFLVRGRASALVVGSNGEAQPLLG